MYIFASHPQRVRFSGVGGGTPKSLLPQGLWIQVFLGNTALNIVSEALSFQFSTFATEDPRPPSVKVGAVVFGISGTSAAQGGLASFLVTVSFISFLDGDTTGRGPGRFSPMGFVGRSHHDAPRPQVM